MVVPKYDQMMLPILQKVGEGQEHSTKSPIDHLVVRLFD